MTKTSYVPTIGIECHVQLATTTKLFSRSDNDARDKAPNTCVNEIDFGLPGMLPVLNKQAVILTIKAGCVLNARIASISRFDRKHYFYPDLPKGYQISQLYHPLVEGGYVRFELPDGEEKKVRIHHAHLEEDAGKLTHQRDYSLVDLNRAGTPLIEIVSEPDIHSAQEAKAYAQELYLLMTYAGVTQGDLYHGNMRFDVNVSLAPYDSATLGTRTETKNLNSFKSVERAVEFEIERQTELLEKGQPVRQETRGWDEAKQKTTSQRSKEEAHDYRYMPDPDIPPLVISREMIQEIQQSIPKLPDEYRETFASLELDNSVIIALLHQQIVAQIIVAVYEASDAKTARRIANLYASAVDQEQNSKINIKIDVSRLIKLAAMMNENILSSSAAKKVFNEMLQGDTQDPQLIAEKHGILQTNNEDELKKIIEEVFQDPAAQKALDDIRQGNEKAIGFLVGLVMKKSQGKANPGIVQKIIKQKL